MAADHKFTLVIDAGHGGHDSGAKGAFSSEKDINLNVALAFGRYVERNCPDVRVIYTRRTDVFVPLYERADIANRNKADLFVSVHTNALPGGRISRGLQTYTLGDGRSHGTKTNLDVAKRENSVILLEADYKHHYVGYDPNSPESNIMFELVQDKNLSKSVDMAKMVQQQVGVAANRPDKGVYQSNLAVLRLTSMPACLIELGFITTPDEEQLLNSSGTVDALGRGIYNAFLKFKQKYGGGTVAPFAEAADTGTENPSVDNQEQDDKVPPMRKNSRRHRNADTQVQQEMPSDGPSTKEIPMPDASQSQSQNQSQNQGQADLTMTRQPAMAPPVQENPRMAADDAGDAGASGLTDSMPASIPPRSDGNANIPSASAESNHAPVFKVQILASSRSLRSDSSQFCGETDVDSYTENDMTKYTIGSSANYNEIFRLRKTLLGKFPQAFIIAFKDGTKMNINDAIREFKSNRNK